jgi:bifunctional DNase/RNase
MRCEECEAAAVLHITDARGRSAIDERHLCEEHCRQFLEAHPTPAQDVPRRRSSSEGILAAHAIEGASAGHRATSSETEVDLGRLIISEIHEQQVVYLGVVGGDRTFAMVCGIFEATAIDRALKELPSPRPLTHDAWASTIVSMGGEVQDVLISDLRDYIYYAEVRIRQAGRLATVDVRPSDAFVLALKCGAPILVPERLLAVICAG